MEAKTELLKVSEKNPPSRTTKAAMETLRASIAKRGIIYPILIDKDMNVIDGHRRLAVARALGIVRVPVCVVEDEDTDEVFKEINASVRKLGARESVWVYLHGGAVDDRDMVPLVRVENAMGRGFLQMLYDTKQSPRSLWEVASQVARHCDYPGDEEFIIATVAWMARGRRQTMARRAVEQGAPPAVIVAAIQKDNDLRLAWM